MIDIQFKKYYLKYFLGLMALLIMIGGYVFSAHALDKTGVGSLEVKGFYLGMSKSEALKKIGKGAKCQSCRDLLGYTEGQYGDVEYQALPFLHKKNKVEYDWVKRNYHPVLFKLCYSLSGHSIVGIDELTDKVILIGLVWRKAFGADNMSLNSFMKQFVKEYKLPEMKSDFWYNKHTDKREEYYSYTSPKGYRVALRWVFLYILASKSDIKKGVIEERDKKRKEIKKAFKEYNRMKEREWEENKRIQKEWDKKKKK